MAALKFCTQNRSATEIVTSPTKSSPHGGGFVTASKPNSTQGPGSGGFLHRSSTIDYDIEQKFIIAARESRSSSLKSLSSLKPPKDDFDEGSSFIIIITIILPSLILFSILIITIVFHCPPLTSLKKHTHKIDSDSEIDSPQSGATKTEAIALFNDSPTKGIKVLVNLGVVQETPDSVASYFRECRELDKVWNIVFFFFFFFLIVLTDPFLPPPPLKQKAIGDYLGEREPFNMKVLQSFVKKMNFSEDTFEKALRKLLAGFRLPGESQKIERIMEIFAEVFTSQQMLQGAFKSSDAVFVLSYSTIMLNTDLHNPQVKRKMTLEQFVSNNRGFFFFFFFFSSFIHALD